MSRDEFIRRLASLVRGGQLTEAQAVELLMMFDRGLIDADQLALPNRESSALVTADVSLALLAWLLARRYGASRLALVGQTPAQALATGHWVIEDFGARVRRLAPRLAAGDVRGWHREMRDAIRDNLVVQAQLGGRRFLNAAEREALAGVANRQLAFLQRFADEAAARNLLAGTPAGKGLRPFSEAYIIARSELYAGEGYAQFFTYSESTLGDGYVIDYQAVDDKGTCSPCHRAELAGPYLPGQGPMPGRVCLGRGRCRCVRVPRRAPDEARVLREQALAVE